MADSISQKYKKLESVLEKCKKENLKLLARVNNLTEIIAELKEKNLKAQQKNVKSLDEIKNIRAKPSFEDFIKQQYDTNAGIEK